MGKKDKQKQAVKGEGVKVGKEGAVEYDSRYYYSQTTSIIAISAFLVLLVVVAIGAYGWPWPLLKLLFVDKDPVAWKAVKVLFVYYIGGGFVLMWIFSWLYDRFTSQTEQQAKGKDKKKK